MLRVADGEPGFVKKNKAGMFVASKTLANSLKKQKSTR
jgi:hypothetical protein